METVSVLLVDSDSSVRETFVLAFKHARFHLRSQVYDVPAGIQLCRDFQPRIVVLSLCGYDGHGIDAVGKFKKAAPNARIVVTHDPRTARMMPAAMQAGACACLKKPFSHERLIATLQRAEKSKGGLSASASAMTARVRASRLRALVRPEGDRVWHKGFVTHLTPSGFTLISDLVLRTPAHVAIRIFPSSGDRIKGVARINAIEARASGPSRATAVFIERKGTIPRGAAAPAAERGSGPRTRRLPCNASVERVTTMEDTYVVCLSGALDERAMNSVVQAMAAVPEGPATVIFDMAKVDRVNSSGIGVLISIFGRIEERQGRAVVCAVQNTVMPILESIGVKELVNICADQIEAVSVVTGRERA